MSEPPSFLQWRLIPCEGGPHLSVHLSLDGRWAVSPAWLLREGLLWIQVYRYLFEAPLSLLLGFAQKWNCWSYGISMFNFLRNCHTVSHRSCDSFLLTCFERSLKRKWDSRKWIVWPETHKGNQFFRSYRAKPQSLGSGCGWCPHLPLLCHGGPTSGQAGALSLHTGGGNHASPCPHTSRTSPSPTLTCSKPQSAPSWLWAVFLPAKEPAPARKTWSWEEWNLGMWGTKIPPPQMQLWHL